MNVDDDTMSDEMEDNPFEFPSMFFNGIYFPPDSDTATLQGEIGGEAQAVYITVFRKEFRVTIEITSDLNAAGFSVSNDSFEGVEFGEYTNEGRTWTGTIPKSGIYYVSVVGHSSEPDAPSAFNYTIKVTATF